MHTFSCFVKRARDTETKHPQQFVGCDGEALKFNDEIEKRHESLGEIEAWGWGESCRSLVSLRGSELLTDKRPEVVTCIKAVMAQHRECMKCL